MRLALAVIVSYTALFITALSVWWWGYGPYLKEIGVVK